MNTPLWTPAPERAAHTHLAAFQAVAAHRAGAPPHGYRELHRWSVEHPEVFWQLVWETAGVLGDGPGTPVLEHGDRMPGARWFPGARLNYAENLLRGPDAALAVIALDERGRRRTLTRGELRAAVARCAAALRAAGVARGDRVAGDLPNCPEALIAMLAAASLGAVWSSCSPDFGPRGILDRFGQIEPRVLFFADGYTYGGKPHDLRPRIAGILEQLPSVERAVLVPFLDEDSTPGPVEDAVCLAEFLAPHRGARLSCERLPFEHPLAILFSSGTTGAPKCIVHSAGGTLLQHLKEHRLHCDVQPLDRVFYFTTCGWMMWNWLASALASEATLVLHDGAPQHPEADALFRHAAAEQVAVFGTSAKYLDQLRKSGAVPRQRHDLSRLRTVLSTGSPLLPEGFDFVYQAVNPDVHLASISGGTDIVSCFVLGVPTEPVWRGEIQGPGLGMDVAVLDESGVPVTGARGELVCRRPFPSMPVAFLGDPGGHRYRAAYFERFPGVWHHGDLAEETVHGGFVIHGRSDAVLNPGGVRIGTAEIYRPVEAFDEVEECVAVGQEWHGDVRIVLFLRLRPGRSLDAELEERLRRALRIQASPRHVPARILAVPDIPRTRSGKISEIAVRECLHGRAVKNTEALANPEALEYFRDLAALQQ